MCSIFWNIFLFFRNKLGYNYVFLRTNLNLIILEQKQTNVPKIFEIPQIQVYSLLKAKEFV